MTRYVLKRLLMMIPVLLGVAIIIFTIMYFVPGDPAEIILGTDATVEAIAAKRAQLGLDDPYFVRLGQYLYDLFIRFDLGTSYITETPVLQEIIVRFPRTFVLASLCILMRVLVGTTLGIAAAVNRNKLTDRICMFLALIGTSLPNFWLAIMLVILFSVKLNWLPAFGIDGPSSFVLPVIAGSFSGMGLQARQTRSSVLEVIRSDYVTTARAKGLRENVVLYKHALPNALIPLIQIVGEGFGISLGGTLIIENVFSIPGMGMYLQTAVSKRDYPIVLGVVVFLALIFGLVMLLVDLAFAFVDPRIKAQYEGQGRAFAFKGRKKNA